MSFEHWLRCGTRLGAMGRGIGWWLGDWVNYGNSAYGEKYTRAARVTGYDTQSLMNMAYVASRIEPSRRRQALSWSHHAEVAALPPADQDRWLERAEQNRLSVRCLRTELRRARDEVAATAPDEDSGVAGVPAHAARLCPHCGSALASDRTSELSNERPARAPIAPE